MVSKWWIRRAACILPHARVINRKFTPNQIDSDFSPIFGEFNLNANTCDLSTAVSQELSCGINRNRTKRDDRGREMFFLLRMAFWLGLVLVLLPREKTPESEKLPQIGASEAVSAATAAVSDMSQFCKRQPAACEVGGQAATVIGQRAQDGARKLYQIITDKVREQEGARPHRLDRRRRCRDIADRGGRAARYADAGRSAPWNGASRRRRERKLSPEPVPFSDRFRSPAILYMALGMGRGPR